MNLEDIGKSYYLKNEKIEALKKFTYNFEYGKFYAIMGESGSGKSTLLQIMGLLLNSDTGIYYLDKKDTSKLTDDELSKLRMKNIGFIFQNYCLDPNLKAYENIMLPMLINDEINKNNRKQKAIELLEMVGLKDRRNHYPSQLSGGEQQRICIARAMANNPKIILADEPTGNLDEENEKIIFEKLKQLSDDGKCVIVVSHSVKIKDYTKNVLQLKKGTLI